MAFLITVVLRSFAYLGCTNSELWRNDETRFGGRLKGISKFLRCGSQEGTIQILYTTLNSSLSPVELDELAADDDEL